jgi:CRISPR-associated protein Cas2
MTRKKRILVTYDVSTETVDGRRRLRKVAQVCCAFGVRVQKSVFECALSEAQTMRMVSMLVSVIDQSQDSLRLYPIPADGRQVRVFGVESQLDMEGLLLI